MHLSQHLFVKNLHNKDQILLGNQAGFQLFHNIFFFENRRMQDTQSHGIVIICVYSWKDIEENLSHYNLDDLFWEQMHAQLRHFLFKLASVPFDKLLRLYSSIDLILNSSDKWFIYRKAEHLDRVRRGRMFFSVLWTERTIVSWDKTAVRSCGEARLSTRASWFVNRSHGYWHSLIEWFQQLRQERETAGRDGASWSPPEAFLGYIWQSFFFFLAVKLLFY